MKILVSTFNAATGEVLGNQVFDSDTAHDDAALYMATTTVAEGLKLISDDVVQDVINATAAAFLKTSDWYVVRFAETAVAIPDDVKAKRAAARAAIVK